MAEWWGLPNGTTSPAPLCAGPALDVYALGLSLLEALTPEEDTPILLAHKLACGSPKSAWWSWFVAPSNVEAAIEARLGAVDDKRARSLLTSMLRHDAQVRSSVDDCLEHPWLAAASSGQVPPANL
eukprot:TRINITY_DN71547_c0_g1_i1.p1 TRINITY_DN71547_c0_g1~~TRINITY_DN71547_c0_g1_i1.p1  ORF type:complete len:138 (-),score=24.79 TRINITY_DN71547_c0_g1_i1:130-507(-)